MTADPRTVRRAAVALPLAVVAISTSSVIILAASPAVPALALATWRMVIAAAVAVAAAGASADARRHVAGLGRRAWALAALAGVLLAGHFVLWVPSVTGTQVASSVALVTTSPLWVALLSPRLIGEAVGWHLRGAVVLGFAGALTIMAGDAVTFGRGHLAADALALGGALAVAGYFIVGRGLRRTLTLSAYLAVVYSAAALWLLAAAALTDTPLAGWSGRHWSLVVAFALLPQVVGHSTLNWALARLSATYVAAATLVEPVGSTLLAWWLFDQLPARSAWLGGGLILVALTWATVAELPATRHSPARSTATDGGGSHGVGKGGRT